MSNAMMNHVRNIKTGRPTANHVMRYLADCHNPKAGAFPSLKRIARDTELSIQSVRRAITLLIDKGIICKRIEHRGGKIARTFYDFIGTTQEATTEAIGTTQERDRYHTGTTYIKEVLKRNGNVKEEEGTADHFEEIGLLLETALTPKQKQLAAEKISPLLTDLFLEYARMRTARPDLKWQSRRPALKFEYLLRDFPRDWKREIEEKLNEQHKNNSALPTPAEKAAAEREARGPLRKPDESMPIMQSSGQHHSELSNGGRPATATV